MGGSLSAPRASRALGAGVPATVRGPENPRPELGGLEIQIGRLRQGIGRLIDSYADGIIEKMEFEPRIARMRERLKQMEEQAQYVKDEASLERELRLILGRLEDFVSKIQEGLHMADWSTRRDIIRALVKRVEIDQEQVHVIFRVNPITPSSPSEKNTQSLQHCGGRDDASLRGSLLRCVKRPIFDVSGFEPLLDQFLARDRPNGFEQIIVRNVVECPPDVGIENPLFGLVWSGQAVDFLNGIMAASAWSESVATSLKPGLPGRFKRILDHCLKAAIHHNGDSERPELVVGFWDVNPSCWFGFPEGVVGESINHSSSCGWCFYHQFIHSRRVFPSVDLCYSSDAHQPIRVAFQHELLERAHLLQVALLCGPKDSLSQVTNSPIGFAPIDGVPVGLFLGSVC